MSTPKMSPHAIAAEPGFAVCEPIHGGKDIVEIAFAPVVAWLVTPAYDDKSDELLAVHVSPVTLEGHSPRNAPPYIRKPDGTVYHFSGDFENIDASLADMKQEQQREAARRERARADAERKAHKVA